MYLHFGIIILRRDPLGYRSQTVERNRFAAEGKQDWYDGLRRKTARIAGQPVT